VITITDWIASIVSSVKPVTAKGYVNALRSTHIENGWSDASFSDPRIDLVIRGAKRVYGEGKRLLRLPLTEDILLRLLPLVPSDHDGLNLRAAICVGFAGFLRSGEFTWDLWDPETSPRRLLAHQHILLHVDSAVITLPSSKTDPFAHGTTIYLAGRPGSPLCPVSALRALTHEHPAPPNAPVFSRLMGAFSKPYFIGKLREYLLRAGFATSGYSGHSLRKGAAVSAARKGMSKEDIKRLGRWRSDAVDLYISEIPPSTLAASLLSLNSRFASLGPLNLSPPSMLPSSHSLPSQRLARKDLQRSPRGKFQLRDRPNH
jgi:hypothetical protein